MANHCVASPVASGGKLYAAGAPGKLIVFQAGDTLELLAKNDLGERITATPAVLDRRLYVRTVKHLYAFGENPVLTQRSVVVRICVEADLVSKSSRERP